MPPTASEACLVCGSRDFRTIYSSTFEGGVEEAADYFLAQRTATAHGQICQCEECGFVFTSPRFQSREYDAIYGSITDSREILQQYDAAKVARFKRLKGIVREHIPAGSRLVDFGCGDGAFLSQLNDDQAIGFEIGQGEARFVGKSELVLGDWATAVGSDKFPEHSFKAVTAFDVLEHLPCLPEDVERIRSLLEPDGLLFASVPNIESGISKIMGRRWNMILLEHLWYFSPSTLDSFLAKFGFERIAMHSIPFDASIAHVASRLAQTFGMRGKFAPSGLSKLVVPAPAGIMLGVYQAT